MAQDFEAPSGQPQPQVPPPPKPKSNTKWVIIIIVIVLLLCCCVTGLVLWFSGDVLIEFLEEFSSSELVNLLI